MAEKHQEIGVANYKPETADIRVDIAWEQAKAVLNRLSLGFSLPKPDFDKIRQAVAKDKKPMCFRASFDGKWLGVVAMVGSKVVEKEFEADLSEGGDQKKWRAKLEALKKATTLVSDADLKEFDKKHADPDRAEAVRKSIDEVQRQMKLKALEVKRRQEEVAKLQAELKAKAEELARLQKALQALGG